MAFPGPRLPKDGSDNAPSSEMHRGSDFLSHHLRLHFSLWPMQVPHPRQQLPWLPASFTSDSHGGPGEFSPLLISLLSALSCGSYYLDRLWGFRVMSTVHPRDHISLCDSHLCPLRNLGYNSRLSDQRLEMSVPQSWLKVHLRLVTSRRGG